MLLYLPFDIGRLHFWYCLVSVCSPGDASYFLHLLFLHYWDLSS